MFPGATRWIVGTLPPPRFTTGDLRPGDVDFCYGSRDGQLWPILDRIHGLNLAYETTWEAVVQRQTFLKNHKMGICDIVHSAERTKIDASDLGMSRVVVRNLLTDIYRYPEVDTLLFTGGNSKNGPEYFFRKLLKAYGLQLQVENAEVPRVHRLHLPKILERKPVQLPVAIEPDEPRLESSGLLNGEVRTLRTISLTAPSGAANRAVGALDAYKEFKSKNPEATTVDFRVLQYKKYC